MSRSRAAMIARLSRWLGPWTPATSRPRVDRTVTLHEGHEPFEMWTYRPRGEPSGALLVVPGLHYLGPADVRFDRFLAILADAGIVAHCPMLPELRRLRVDESVVDHALVALDAVEDPIGVFSISFGSYPAIQLAARRPGSVRALTLFGGYADFEEAIRFSLVGDEGRPHDPLNRPVVFLNLLEHVPAVPEDRALLRERWTEYVRRTWGRAEMKEEARWRAVSNEIAARVPARSRHLFEQGTGAAPGGTEIIAEALRTGGASLAHLDPLDACRRVACPVSIVHGRDDDVIPHTQAPRLAEALAHVDPTLILTGLYGHTTSGLVDLRAIGQELRAMVGILEAIVDGARAGG